MNLKKNEIKNLQKYKKYYTEIKLRKEIEEEKKF